MEDYHNLEHGYLIDGIRLLLQIKQNVSIAYGPRTANAVAHRLASEAYESDNKLEWTDAVPFMLKDGLGERPVLGSLARAGEEAEAKLPK
ncbi:hypothetical protein ACLB2K_010375 [Fragaria x ananassa]